jgi:hypothetical protein
LQVEIGVVQSICCLMAPQNESPVRVLPWSDEIRSPISLPKQAAALQLLNSSGGTDPSVLYSSPDCLQALSSCGLWFLLTDGEIEDELVEKFALNIAANGLHGLPCVAIVFGSTMNCPPAACNISVGIATYAAVPDCLFLFHDLPTGRLSILQAKGCFKELLPKFEQSYAQPELGKYTKWADLPLISYSNLAKVNVPPARKLSMDELALQDNIVIRMQDLYSGNVDEDLIGEIFKNEDNVKSIALAEASKGAGNQLTDWLLSQEKPLPELTSERPDVGEKAQHAVVSLLETLKTGTSDEGITSLRAALRVAHEENWREFQRAIQSHFEGKKIVASHNYRCRRARVDSNDVYDTMETNRRESNKGSSYFGNVWGRNVDDNQYSSEISESYQPDSLFLPGFKRCLNTPGSEFVGQCMLCYKESILAILLKSPPNVSTPNFPRRGSHTALTFPLAMSRFAETDVVSFFLCCDSCALYLVRNCASPLQETITGALALTSLKTNKSLWLETLDLIFDGRFKMTDLPTVFVAVLDRMILKNKLRSATNEQRSLYHGALRWAKSELSEIAEVSESLSPSLGQLHRRGHNRRGFKERTLTLQTVISNRALFDPGEAANTDISMLRYPIDGFPVLIRLLQDHGLPEEELQKHIFQRLVFYLTEFCLPTLKDQYDGKHYDLPKLLHRLPTQSFTPESHSTLRDIAPKISIEDLLGSEILNPGVLETFRSMEEFGDVEKRTEPAIAVYLHALSVYGRDFASPTDFFNAFKSSTWLKMVVHSPFGISEGLSVDLASQISKRRLEA